MRLALRDLFWLVLIAALAITWFQEHTRVAAVFATAHSGSLQLYGDPPDYAEIAARPQRIAALQSLSETELTGRTPFYLHEMIRRQMRDELREMYLHFQETSRRDRTKPNAPKVWDNRQLLTAWRRTEGKPDPIEIEVVSIGRDAQGKPIPGPLILPRIKNVDHEGLPFFIEEVGDIEGPALWRVQLMDAQGAVVGGVDVGQVEDQRRIPNAQMLLPGMSEDCDFLLDARRYIKSPAPGRYSLTLVHAIRPIANTDDLAGRIVWKSAPVPVIVENLSKTSKWELVRFPLALIAAVLVGCCALLCRRLIRSDSSRSSISLQAHDWLALAVITLLAAGWCTDIFRMKHQMDHTGFDLRASWTMRLAE